MTIDAKPPAARLNPHGRGVPCNLYCQGDEEHTIILLATHWDDDGEPLTEATFLAAFRAYYSAVGWRPIRARQVEAETAAIYRQLQRQGTRAVITTAYQEEEVPIVTPPPLEDYAPWRVTVVPLGAA